MFSSSAVTNDWVLSTNFCRVGPRPPTAWAVSSSRFGILLAGIAASAALARSNAGPIGTGIVLLVIVWPASKYSPGLPADTRSMYCSPTAVTERTLALASTGILYLSLMLRLATAPVSVGSTSVTRPIVTPR